MKTYNVAILGATGAVGREMLKILQQRQFPVGDLLLLSGARSAGKRLDFCGEQIPVSNAQYAALSNVDIVLGAAENDVVLAKTPQILESGAVLIDNSSAYRLDPSVPLVIPPINGADAKNHRGIIANPNCTTVIALTAIAPLRPLGQIRSIWAASYQAVSGAGTAGMRELAAQNRALLSGGQYRPQAFPYQIAYNLIPQIGRVQAQGYTTEELKLQFEGRRILHAPELTASCTCVRVPVMRSHSVAMSVGFDRAVDVQQARTLLENDPDCVFLDDPDNGEYPMPLTASDQDAVLVGRLRPDLTDERRLVLWCCGDQLRKGAATNAVQIAELLIA